ncbi:sugar ABC transporter permease [Acrocarpospora corrugata]|uniref:Sugar ABC transporter permease n=1 Tax=Acrocarpospora corrugata TaxID=35763 RepID=A0A5M3VTT4_9ACTN|nr:carbohydrate ABC transporter permease [Acrocarpospora corrugata]GER98130.1 sugar ABC transporter permease [Acrocarpospora corrugata]
MIDARTHAWLRPLVAIFVGAAFFLPLYLMLVNVFKPGDEILPSPASLPLPPTLENISGVFAREDNLFTFGLINSIAVTALSITILTVLSAMLGHYLARSTRLFSKLLLVVLLCGLMIPIPVILSPMTSVLKAFDLMATLQGLVLVNVGYYVPFGVLLFMGFVKSVPRELEEAAELDGASKIRVFWQVVFPLLRPASASVLIFLGVWIWNDFLTPLIVLGPDSGTTVTVGVYRAIGQYESDFGDLFAFMFLATLPILIFYLALQKNFVKGLTGGAVKG